MTEQSPPRRYGFESFLEVVIERLERRLWLTVYGIVAVILAAAFQSFLVQLP